MAFDPAEFAQEWQAAWNAHNLPRTLSHYTDSVVFRSRQAMALFGTEELRGKSALRDYWSMALERQPDLRFHLRDAFQGHDTLVLTYENHRGVLAAETLSFTVDLAWQASACRASE